ncbi:MAG: hypothetical protein MUF45_12610 [Spirosomaceae bacterium]|jgi:hypothetical protein|nr:hypothetical protein [Spirosomataceae bacterium]
MKKLFFILVTVLCVANAQAQNTPFNALRLSGQTMNFQEISFMSIGKITITPGESKDINKADKIKFRIYLKRSNQIVNHGLSSDKREITEVEISEVLQYAHCGDQLIIETTDKNRPKTKRIFNLPLTMFNYIAFINKDGC